MSIGSSGRFLDISLTFFLLLHRENSQLFQRLSCIYSSIFLKTVGKTYICLFLFPDLIDDSCRRARQPPFPGRQKRRETPFPGRKKYREIMGQRLANRHPTAGKLFLAILSTFPSFVQLSRKAEFAVVGSSRLIKCLNNKRLLINYKVTSKNQIYVIRLEGLLMRQ